MPINESQSFSNNIIHYRTILGEFYYTDKLQNSIRKILNFKFHVTQFVKETFTNSHMYTIKYNYVLQTTTNQPFINPMKIVFFT